MASSLNTMVLFALVALVGTLVALPITESDDPTADTMEAFENELTTALMGAEMEVGEVLVCSVDNEKSGSLNCVWEKQITLYHIDENEALQLKKKKCQTTCWNNPKGQRICGVKCSF